MRFFGHALGLFILSAVIGGTLALQHQTNTELRGMIGLFRERNQAADRLREERLRLVATQIPPAELENLRTDHASIERLRAEMERARARLLEVERQN